MQTNYGRLKELRQNLHITIPQAAGIAGISTGSLCQYEKNGRGGYKVLDRCAWLRKKFERDWKKKVGYESKKMNLV